MKFKRISVYGGTTSEHVEECRRLLAQSPDSNFVRHRLAVSLFLDGQYAEAAKLASQVAPEGDGELPRQGPTTRFEALKEIALSTRRVRPFVEEEARQIPGKDAFRMTMEAFDKVIRGFEEEVAAEEKLGKDGG